MRTMRIALGAAAAALMSLALAAPASAVPLTINLKADHLNVTAEKFDGDTCDGPFDDLSINKDGWHFVLPASSGSDFLSLSLTFSSPGGSVPVTITGTQAAPSTGPGWSGYIDNAGASDKHAYLIADAGWTLTAGSASVEGAEQGDVFNLSHTCAGDPDATPSPDPSTSPSSSATPTPSGSTSQSPGTSVSPTPGGDLPRTGLPVTTFVVTGLVMLAGGAALLAVRRRRDITEV